jgi:hypothetical protein
MLIFRYECPTPIWLNAYSMKEVSRLVDDYLANKENPQPNKDLFQAVLKCGDHHKCPDLRMLTKMI